MKALLTAVRTDRINSHCYSPEEKIDIHRNHLTRFREEQWTYWGVNFRINPDRFVFPIHMYLAKTGTRMIQYRAKVMGLETCKTKYFPEKPAHMPPDFAKIEHRTYFEIRCIEKLSEPLEVTSMKKLSDRKYVKRLNESYIGICDPLQ